MTTNLVGRIPVPGSFGVQPSTNVFVHIQTTDTVAQSTVTVSIDGHNAILNGAFRPGYAGTILTDGAGGWNITINPSTNFTYGSAPSVVVTCVETTGSVVFSQSYSFQVIRNIGVSAAVCYFEEGDVLEADCWAHEDQTVHPELVDNMTFRLLRSGTVIDTVSIENKNHDAHSEGGAFRIRLLHPPQINQQMTFEVSMSINGYGAPGVGTVTIAGTVEWESRKKDTLQNAQQPDLRIGAAVPHTEPSEYGTTAQQTSKQAEYESVDIKKSTDGLIEPTLLVDLDFLNTSQYLQALEGDLTYTGGGNRLLNGVDDTTDWFLQEADELPVTFGARTLVEGPATNLLAHSSFDVNQFTVTLPDGTVRADTEVIDLTTGVKQLTYAVEGTVTFDGNARNVAFSSPKVTLTPGQPVLCSVLARTLLRDDKVTLDTFALRVRFYNVSNAQVGSTDFNFDIFAFQSETTFSLMEALTPTSSIPVGATQASFDIVVGSWEGCDLMNLWLAAPMIEHALFTTSRVVGSAAGVHRTADNFRIQQAGNINQLHGRMSATYAPQYEGSPPVNVCVFDTRAAGTLRSGYVLRHRTDGKFELTAVSDTGAQTVLLTAAAVPLTFGKPVELIAQWTPSSLRIFEGQLVLAEQTGTYVQPKTIQSEISIGQKIDGTEPLYGELHAFRSYGIA